MTRLAAMPGRLWKSLLACALAFALAGCGGGNGGDGTIPADDASEMLDFLNATETQLASGNCDVAVEQAGLLVEKVDALPADVGVETKDALRRASQNLISLAQGSSACADGDDEEETATTDTETDTTDTDTTDTTDTTTDTETETTTDEDTDDEETGTTETTTDTEIEPPPTDDGPVIGGEGEINQGGPPSGGVDDEKR